MDAGSGIWVILVGAYVAIVALGRSQREAKRRAQQGQGGGPAPDAPVPRGSRLREMMAELDAEEQARSKLEVVVTPEWGSRRPATVEVRPQAPAPPPTDFDAQAVALTESRRRAAETPAFLPPAEVQALEGQRTPPAPRITSRIESRIVDRVVAPAAALATGAAVSPAGAPPGRSAAAARLAQLAGGGLRGAVVLSEILGPPKAGT